MKPAVGDWDRAVVDDTSSAPLSLKDREAASLSLKRIFDQQLQLQQQQRSITTTSDADDINVDKERHAAGSAAHHHPDLELRLATPTPAAASTSYTKTNNWYASRLHEDERHAGQLTIFYGGTVRVYEDVPTDKANAIMLLAAGNGDIYRANYPSTLRSAVSAPHIINKSRSTTPAPSPDLTITTRSENTPSRSQAELPFARKASLTRFLTKRKDRVAEKVEKVLASSPPPKRPRSTSPMHI